MNNLATQMIKVQEILNNNILGDRDIDEVDKNFIKLLNSIRSGGLIHPITIKVYNNGGFKYRVVCGQRRIRVFEILGLETIPAIILEEPEIKLEMSKIFDENTKRKSLKKISEVKTILKMIHINYLISLNVDEQNINFDTLENDSFELSNTFVKIFLKKGLQKAQLNDEESNILFAFQKACDSIGISLINLVKKIELLKYQPDILFLKEKEFITTVTAKRLNNIKSHEKFQEIISLFKNKKENALEKLKDIEEDVLNTNPNFLILEKSEQLFKRIKGLHKKNIPINEPEKVLKYLEHLEILTRQTNEIEKGKRKS